MTMTAANGATVLSQRRTADNKRVLLWSDGWLTDGMSFELRGGRLTPDLMWAVAGDLSLFTWAELTPALRAVKRHSKRKNPDLCPGMLRSVMAAALSST